MTGRVMKTFKHVFGNRETGVAVCSCAAGEQIAINAMTLSGVTRRRSAGSRRDRDCRATLDRDG